METLEELQELAYRELDNYKIEYTGEEKECVAVYLTSNNLFFPHDVEHFRWSVLEKDRFEWTRLKIRRATKHIFLRDIYKQWYASGVNAKINTLDKLIEWLRNEIKDYKSLIISGSSGGGYAAALIGSKLKADIVISFNGQWYITDNIEHDGKVVSPVLKRMVEEGADGVKYFDIARSEFDYPRTFYFVSTRSPWDARQLKCVSAFKNIHIIRFRNSHHGIPFLKSSLPRVLNMSYDELCKLEKHSHLPLLFDVRIAGFVPTVKCLLHIINKKIFK